MSGSIENLLVRNLRSLRGARPGTARDRDRGDIRSRSRLLRSARPARRARAVNDAVVTLQAQFPDHVFSQIGNVDAPQDSERLAWAFGPPHQPRQITGLDVAVVNAGRISGVYTFFDPTGA